MNKRLAYACLLLAGFAVASRGWPQSRGAAHAVKVNPDGSVSVNNALVARHLGK